MNKALRQYLATIGRKGGKRKSAAKTAAARRNGKIGNRVRWAKKS